MKKKKAGICIASVSLLLGLAGIANGQVPDGWQVVDGGWSYGEAYYLPGENPGSLPMGTLFRRARQQATWQAERDSAMVALLFPGSIAVVDAPSGLDFIGPPVSSLVPWVVAIPPEDP